jgi:hypothetical protein
METMGEKYVMPPVLDYRTIHRQSSPTTPIVFILSPGADPAFDVFNLGEEMGFKPGAKLKYMALGQGTWHPSWRHLHFVALLSELSCVGSRKISLHFFLADHSFQQIFDAKDLTYLHHTYVLKVGKENYMQYDHSYYHSKFISFLQPNMISIRTCLFCIQHLACLVSFRSMLGDSFVEVWMKNILKWFIEGQTHFGISRGAKVSLALNESKEVALHSNSNTTLDKPTPQVEKTLLIFYANQPMENHGGWTPNEKLPWVKG